MPRLSATERAARERRLRIRERRTLLEHLRAESARIKYGYFERTAAPTLYDLAQAAKVARGRFVSFRGVRFQLAFGFWKYVRDPETGGTLVGTSGGLL